MFFRMQQPEQFILCHCSIGIDIWIYTNKGLITCVFEQHVFTSRKPHINIQDIDDSFFEIPEFRKASTAQQARWSRHMSSHNFRLGVCPCLSC